MRNNLNKLIAGVSVWRRARRSIQLSYHASLATSLFNDSYAATSTSASPKISEHLEQHSRNVEPDADYFRFAREVLVPVLHPLGNIVPTSVFGLCPILELLISSWHSLLRSHVLLLNLTRMIKSSAVAFQFS